MDCRETSGRLNEGCLSVVKDATGSVKDVTGIRRDIVETKIAEKELADSERRIVQPSQEEIETYDPTTRKLKRKLQEYYPKFHAYTTRQRLTPFSIGVAVFVYALLLTMLALLTISWFKH